MNFISTFDELNKLYEEVDVKKAEEVRADELAEAANEEPIEEGLLDGRQTKVGEFEFKYQGTIASTKGISDPEVLAKLYAKRKGLEYGQVYNDLAHSNYRDNLFLTSSGVIFKNNKKNTYSITWKDELTNKKITEVVPSQSNFKIEGSDTEVKDILVEILSDYYAQITITGVDNYIGDDGNIKEGITDGYRKKFDKPASIRTQQAWEDELRQVICECDKCGALIIKDEADIVVDEESDLVNVEEECQFCEEAKGFKIVGVVAPYEVAEEVTEAFGLFKNKKPKPWSELEATHKLVPTEANNLKVGDWTMTKPDQDINDVTGKALVYPVTGFSKLANSNNVVLKFEGSHSMNTNQNTVLLKAVKNDTVEEDIEPMDESFIGMELWYHKKTDKPYSIPVQQQLESELNGECGKISDKRRKEIENIFEWQRDWEKRHPEYKSQTPVMKPRNQTADDEELDELFNANIKVDARGFGGSGNDVSVLGH